MAAKRLRIFPQAERDIDAQVIYLAERADIATAIRYFDATHQTFRNITDWPSTGTLRLATNPRLAGIRQWPVSGFENHLIFYRIETDEIQIVRVIHGARDLDRILSQETNID